jgi:conjugal transfer ATP-binding protein TraC
VAIAENSANMFLLGQKSETVERIKNDGRLMMSDGAFAFLKSVKTIPGSFSEIFIKTNNGVGIARLMVDRFTSLLYSSNPKDLELIKNKTRNGMTVAEAISAIVND